MDPSIFKTDGSHVLYRDGVAVAVCRKSGITLLAEIDERDQWQVRNRLARQRMPAAYHATPTRPA